MPSSKIMGLTAVTSQLVLSLILFPIAPASAQEPQALEIEEIIVTARARQEVLQNVPASITVLTESDIERAGIRRADDIIALTPGVAMVNVAYASDMQVSIRGLNRARDAEANFAFIIDGIHYANPWAFNREFSDLAQIEVLKGPQGALYGRSASSGAVIITTRTPGNEVEGEIGGSYASHNTYTADAFISGPIIEDTLFGRFSVDYRDTDGWFKNVYRKTDDEINQSENWSASGRLVWNASDALTVDTKLRFASVDAGAIAYNAAFALPFFEQFIGPDAFIDVNEHEFVFSPNVPSKNTQDTLEASIKFDYEMGWATLSGWALYSDLEDAYIADGTSGSFGFYFDDPVCLATTAERAGTPVQSPGFIGQTPAGSLFTPFGPTTCDGFQYNEHNQEDVSMLVSLTSPGDQRLRWQAGVYWLDLEREVGISQQRDDGRANLPMSFTSELVDALTLDTLNTEVFAVFGSINYDIRPELEASLAIRYDRESRDVTNRAPGPSQRTSTRIDPCNDPSFGIGGCTLNGMPIEGSPLNPAFFTDFAAGELRDSIPDRSESFSQVQPKLSLTWQASDQWTYFGSWGVGFKSGGFNTTGTSETVEFFLVNPGQALGSELLTPPGIYEKETSSAFELGFKSRLAEGRISMEGAVFYTDVDDMQFFEFYVGPFGLLRVVENIDEVTIKGFELGASAMITEALSLSAAYSKIDGEIKEFRLRSNTVGNEVPNAPEYTFNLTAEYVTPVFEGIDFVGRVDYSLTGDTWFHAVQDDQVATTLQGLPAAIGTDLSRSKRDAYGVVNLRLGFESESWRVAAFANNLFDEDYLGEVLVVPEFGGSFVHPGLTRFVGVEFSYKFF